LNLLRRSIHYRRDAFDAGLLANGFELVNSLPKPKPGDVAVMWNRYGGYHEQALHFERAGAAVLVVENGPLGKDWRAGEWFSLAVGHVAGPGKFADGGPSRWDSWGVKMAPFRTGGRETVILGQRGIGEPGIKSPERWAEVTRHRHGGRIRLHPAGKESHVVPLLDDLADAREVITWHSGAALLALLAGIPVWCDFPQWIGIGADAARPLSEWPGEPQRFDAARLAIFRRLAWATWNLDEIRTGEPIARLLANY
jgi:hypothetical protein